MFSGCHPRKANQNNLQKRSARLKNNTTSQQRIDSYVSNTYLGRMQAIGQFKEAPVSKGFFERWKKSKPKPKKGVKLESKASDNLKFLIMQKD